MNRTAVAQNSNSENISLHSASILQRKCTSCSSKTTAEGECAECANIKGKLQRKLSIGASNDPLEHEADHVADQVMSMSPNSGIARTAPKIQCASKCAGDADALAPTSVNRVLAGSGAQMQPVLRQDMEQRFGHDFSQVRLYTNEAAAKSAHDVSAQAYTVGQNIVFGTGKFSPNMSSGKRLLAHELTHVVQQSGIESNSHFQNNIKRSLSPVTSVVGPSGTQRIQRKVKVNSGVSIDHYLVSGATKSGNTYSHLGASQTSMNDQIITDMLYSTRVFSVKGSTDSDAGTNLSDHVNARKGIVDFAQNKKFTFAAGAGMTMNSKYWEKVAGGWRVKPGEDSMKAMKDVNVTPGLYKIACLAATKITMIAGSGASPLVRDTGVAADDWIPGDWGYIDNTKFVSGTTKIGLEGENIIYTGGQMYWGHFTGSNTYRSLQDWTKEVNGWNVPSGGASLESFRTRPNKGLA